MKLITKQSINSITEIPINESFKKHRVNAKWSTGKTVPLWMPDDFNH